MLIAITRADVSSAHDVKGWVHIRKKGYVATRLSFLHFFPPLNSFIHGKIELFSII